MITRSALEFSPGAAGPLLTGNPLWWQDLAECQYTDPEIFFPERGGSVRAAKRVCARCAVRAECLEYALANGERFGVYGGLSERERRRIKRTPEAAAAPVAPRLCAKRLHAMTEANTRPEGGCRACKNESSRSYRAQHSTGLGRGRTAEPRERGRDGRFTAPVQQDRRAA